MNKIYLSAMAVAFAGSSFAQHAITKDANVMRDGFMPIYGAKHQASEINNNERATILWSEDFESGTTAWIFTNTSAPTLDWTVSNTVSPVPAHGGELNSSTGNGNGGSGKIAWINSDGAGQNNTQDAIMECTTPINLSAVTTSITIRWQQYVRHFGDENILRISNDGGSSWSDIPVNANLGNGTNSANPDYVSFDITSYCETSPGVYSSDVRVAFQYKASWGWFWYIDDIEVIETPDHEVDMISSAYGVATPDFVWGDHMSYGIINEGQASDVLAHYQARNKGSNTEDNITFSSTFDATTVNGLVPTTSLAVSDTARDTSATYTLSGTAPYTVNVNHTMTYDSIAMDDETFNNTNSESFDVDANLYAIDNGIAGGGYWNGAGEDYTLGAMYEIYNATTLTAITCAFDGGNTAAGAVIYPLVLEVDLAAADFQSLWSNVIYDGSLIPGGTYTLTASDISSGATPTWVNLELIGASSPGLNLDAGKSYVVAYAVQGAGSNGDVVSMTSTKQAIGGHYVFNDGTQWWTIGTATPMIRANFDSNLGEVLSVSNIEAGLTLGQNMPNPANGVTNINYSIANTNNITMTIVDFTGKVVKTINEGNKGAGEYTLSIDTEEFSKGVYFYTLTAGNQKLTNRMVVTK